MNTIEARQYLDSFINYETVVAPSNYIPLLKLERVLTLLSLVGNPHKEFKTLHVAGTKGKGSTCIFTAFILQAAGYRTGLFTSPHLSDYKERIRVLDPLNKNENKEDAFSGKIKDEEFCRLLTDIQPHIEQVKKDEKLGKLTFFEIYTVLSLCYFKQRSVDFAVLETGLGGRLDATNAVHSLICAITPISLDHTKLLGSTIAAITKEKAAIIKDKNQIAIIAPQPKEAYEVIDKRCQEMQAKPFFINKDIKYKTIRKDFKEQIFDVTGFWDRYTHLKTTLIGEHQSANASVAIGMIEALRDFGFTIGKKAIEQGIQEAKWPGRFEVMRQDPFIVLDSAHNPGSSKVLAETVQEIFSHKRIILVLGISKDKDTEGICRELNQVADYIVFTKVGNLRAFDFTEDFAKGLFKNKKYIFTANMKDALQAASKEVKINDVILITGSIFTVGEAREICIVQI